ncbi:MAG TPA: D-ribose pyranase [Deinococcales bacterium]|nr:D-ribose pyranase [Deinococcales bacterium]
MNRGYIIHPGLLELIASLGHTDSIVIADAGLPVPQGVPRIDLAFVRGSPSFQSVLEAVSKDLVIESAVMAEEARERSPEMLDQALRFLPRDVSFVSHEEFKRLTRSARAVIRTGETTPYANVILRAGVDF